MSRNTFDGIHRLKHAIEIRDREITLCFYNSGYDEFGMNYLYLFVVQITLV